MQNKTNARALAASALLAMATLGTSLHAESLIEIDDQLAAKVQQQIHLANSSGGHSLTGVTVQAKNGVLQLNGAIEELEAHRAVHDVLKGLNGLHTNQVDDHLIQQ